MVRRPILLRALALVIGLPALAVAWPGAADAAPQQGAADGRAAGTPLVMTIDSLTPGQVPAQGPIRIQGSVTNRDDVPWTLINVYPFISEVPMRTRAELSEATTTPVDEEVGDRITDVGDRLDELQPGASSTFSITLPRGLIDAEISGAAGVYWFGVHAIGSSPDGRDAFADGRSRTLLPLVPQSIGGAVRTALVVPLRRFLGREPDGSLSNPEAWQRSLSDGGRLRDALDLGAAAGPDEISWLLDPALVDAVQRLADGNLPRSLDPTLEPAEPGGSPTPSPTDEDGTEEEEEADPEPPTPEQETAAAWLAELEPALRAQELLTLPYGDLDLAAAADHDRDLIDLARAQVSTTLEAWGISGSPVVGSPSGYFDASAIDATDPGTPVLLSDRAFPGDAPGVANLDGRKLIIASSAGAEGGPAPGSRYDGVALRQRILGEAALRVLEPGRRDPLTVVMPARFSSDGANDFFAGLDVRWLDLMTLSDATDRNGRSVDIDELDYPPRQNTREIDPDTFQAVDALIAHGETLQNVLTLNDRVAAEVTEQALTGASYTARAMQLASRASLNRSRGWIRDQLRSVEIGGPPGVTLSSESGEFVATITNRLEQPVTVSVRAKAGRGIEVTVPETIELAPKSRTSVLLQARTAQASVHNVTLVLTDAEGTPLGSSDRVPIRSAQVSNVIWVIMGTGVLLLLVAILVRLVRRLRRRGRDATDQPTPDEPAPASAGSSP